MPCGVVLALSLCLPSGGLDGVTVFVSPGHGFYYHSTLGWTTQRGNTGSLVEDLETADTVNAFLTGCLRRAGADVWPVRCESPSRVEVVVDDGDPGYEEEGRWSATTSGGWGGDARYAATAPGASAVARFRPAIPVSGRYPVYVWFVAGSNRPSDALVRIRHGGGTDERRITQQRDGRAWRYVGTYWLFAGEGQTVEISADSSETGKAVIADAIRIGGGAGTLAPNDGGPVSGRSRYEECSVYWARYQGAPESVTNPTTDGDGNDDVTCRPRYAEFELESGETGIYLSYHTNAGGGTGTETYMYSGGATAGSQLLRDLLQEEVVADLRSAWDPGWVDRGVKAANFGELRLLGSMPGALIETAFHDHPEDLEAERSPRWRRIVTRAIGQATIRYVGGGEAVLLPEAPAALAVRASGAGGVSLSWREPPSGAAACGAGRATRYRIETSSSGLAFSPAAETSARVRTIADVPPGAPLYARVVALNAAGESVPSRTAVALLPEEAADAAILIVHGFEGDEGVLRRVEAYPGLGDVLRLEPGRSDGGGDGAVDWGRALAAVRRRAAVEFAEVGALAGLDLSGHDLVTLTLGDEAEAGIPEAAAAALLSHLDRGGRLVASASRLASWTSESGGPSAQTLLWRLGADLAGERTAPARLVPEGALGSIAAFEVGAVTDAGLSGVGSFDVLRTLPGAEPVARVGGAGGDVAGVLVRGRSLYLSFPLEAVPLGSFRAAILGRALDALLGPEPPSIGLRAAPDVVTLEDGVGRATLEASGPPDAAYAWDVLEGPPGGATIASESWSVGPAGLGFGDDDDVALVPEEGRGCSSLLLRRTFVVAEPEALESLVLDVRYDDGFAAYLNGVEVARRNVAAGAGPSAFAESAIEPVREEVELLGAASAALRAGENELAISVHNASATSSDLTADPSLRGLLRDAGAVDLIPPGAAWHVRTCGEEASGAWRLPAFDPSGRFATARFTAAGTYVIAVAAETVGGTSPRVTASVRVVSGALRFLRGDANSDGAVDVSDAIAILAHLFLAGPAPCRAALDANASLEADISDAIYLLQFLFLGGAEPPPPGPEACGPEPDGSADCELPAARCR